MGGLIGGEAKKLETHYNKKKNICGDVLQKAMTYAMAVLEVNASMGLIVAAPTAGSAGVVPGMMLALQECYRISDQRIVDALFNAGAVGYLAMRNATVAGAVGGWRLARTVMTHLVATGAVAAGDDLIHTVAGGGLLAKVSKRFGEGVVNGALTARVGIAAMEVCRPLPFIHQPRPKVGNLIARGLKGLFGDEAAK